MFFDTSHVYDDGYSEVIMCDKGLDSVDLKIVNTINKEDILITQDYGLASLVLNKCKYVLNQNGMIYTKDNIDNLLMTRYISKKARDSGIRTKGPSKRTEEQNKAFEKCFEGILTNILD